MGKLFLLVSYIIVLCIGFAAGIFALPILTAPPAPAIEEVMAGSSAARFTGTFRRDLQDSDFLHYGEGKVFIHDDRVAFEGKLAAGPDYRLYFAPEFVETETDFLAGKHLMVDAGPIRTFENFIVPLADDLKPEDYSAVVVWCESFNQFITAASYR